MKNEEVQQLITQLQAYGVNMTYKGPQPVKVDEVDSYLAGKNSCANREDGINGTKRGEEET
ncbi:hypothetical protein GCM10020331_015740 [Ectobacillus funiculus]